MEKELKQKSLRKNTGLISTAVAANMAGVSAVTIQNLCKRGYLSYSLKGKMYMVRKSDVEKYIDSIQEINEATNDIETLKLQLKDKAAQMRTEIGMLEESNKTLLEDLKLQPKRIKAMSEFCCAIMKSYSEKLEHERDYCIVRDILQGINLEEIAIKYYISVNQVKSIWHAALRRIVIVKNKIDDLTEQIENFRQEIERKNYEIMELKSIPSEFVGEWKKRQDLLDLHISEADLSVRTLNCLEFTGIVTIRDLVQTKPAELLRCRNFGKKSLTELQEFLEEKGLYFGIDVDKFMHA